MSDRIMQGIRVNIELEQLKATVLQLLHRPEFQQEIEAKVQKAFDEFVASKLDRQVYETVDRVIKDSVGKAIESELGWNVQNSLSTVIREHFKSLRITSK